MKIGLAQINPAWENKQESMQKITGLLENNDLSGVDLLIFPEMTLTGFTMRSRSFAETEQGETFHYFSEMARTTGTNIIYGFIESADRNYYNTLMHIGTNGLVAAKYRKIHPFSFTGENRFYSAGSEPMITEICGAPFGLSICYDLRFPELFRSYGKQRVTGIINIANWPVQRIDHWSSLLKARAIENLCFVMAVNRIGNDKSNKYNGASTIISPAGNKLMEIKDEERIVLVEIDVQDVAYTRVKFPFLDDIKLI